MSSSESSSPKQVASSFKLDHKEVEPMIKASHQFGPQLNALTNKEKIIENEFLIKHKRLLVVSKITCLLGLMYIFICSLELMSIGFRLIGGKKTNNFLKSELISNPIVGVMIGILVTVLVQSSSTSTSIIVTMVSSDMIKVRYAIPIIMGANIGTSVTNTIVSFMQPGDEDQICRAFAAATVHDCFNMLSVLVLLPFECLTNYLEFITNKIIQLIDLQKQKNHTSELKPFMKEMTAPFINSIVRINNRLLEKIHLDEETNQSDSLLIKCCEKKLFQTNSSVNRLNQNLCIRSCSIINYIGLSDWISGMLLLMIAILLLCVSLIIVVKILNSMLRGKIANIIKIYINTEYKKPWSYLIGYLALLIGCLITIIVQSSSIFTSNLTLLANLGVISLERIYPLTLGSNIGTTTTGILAAFTADQSRIREALQLAFCHLFFNISGIMLFFPFPATRLPITLAKKLGKTTAKYRWFSIFYILFFFLILPLIIFLLSLAGHVIFLLTITPIIILLIAIIVINQLQSNYPLMLPSYLRSFSFLPVWFRSLDAYDALIVMLSKKIPFLSTCVRPEFRHDLAMISIMGQNTNSRLQIIEYSVNNSSN